jgi:dimethylargininase
MQAVPDAYVGATTMGARPVIDLEEARRQHAGIVSAMEWLGYDVTLLPDDGAGADAVFVEDPVVVHGHRAALLQSAHAARAAEGIRLAPALAGWGLELLRMTGFARADGGDVMVVDRTAYIGLSARTNAEGAMAVGQLLGLVVQPIALPPGVLHLKCAVSPLPDGRVLATRALAQAIGLPAVIVPDEEEYAANCVANGQRVVCAAGYPRTAEALDAAGFEVRLVDTTEIAKGDGSLTCLSIRSAVDRPRVSSDE